MTLEYIIKTIEYDLTHMITMADKAIHAIVELRFKM